MIITVVVILISNTYTADKHYQPITISTNITISISNYRKTYSYSGPVYSLTAIDHTYTHTASDISKIMTITMNMTITVVSKCINYDIHAHIYIEQVQLSFKFKAKARLCSGLEAELGVRIRYLKNMIQKLYKFI